jgi:magnesium transporter
MTGVPKEVDMVQAIPGPQGARRAHAPRKNLTDELADSLSVRVPVCSPDDQVGDVRRGLVGTSYDSVDDVAVCDGSRLVGLIALDRLLGSDDHVLARNLMDADPPVVRHRDDLEAAAWKAVHHRESSLAVVDHDGRFVGVIPPARLLGVLLRAHDQDFSRLRRYLESTRSARRATTEPVLTRLRRRFAWLVLGLTGAGLSAWLVGLFEWRLEADVRLAFFIPGVVYLADAVGTQTEAVVVRGLSVGAPVRTTLRLEAATGPVLGAVLGVISLLAVWWVLDDPNVALAVALALLGACSVATIVAAGIPVLLARLGRDPAYASGPLATVVQDLVSLAIYLAVATLVV